MYNETIIQNAENVILLIRENIITKQEVRKFLGLKGNTDKKVIIDGKVYRREEND